jgi:serine/threonine-protein phosphatase 2A activator
MSTLRALRRISPSTVHSLPRPTPKIQTETHLQHFQNSRGYSDYLLFLRRLNEAVVRKYLPIPDDHVPSEVGFIKYLGKTF